MNAYATPCTTELVVCTTCRASGAPRSEPAAGQRLLEEVLAQGGEEPGMRVRGQACLAACSRACTVALQAPGKWTYLFGGLAPDASSAAAVLAGARLHRDASDGALGWKDRPEALRSGTIARVMPLDGGVERAVVASASADAT